MPPGRGAELDRVVDGTGGPSVPEELSRAGGFEGKSPTKEQASRVLWLYCSRSMNLLNQMVITVVHMDISCTQTM